MERLGYVSEVVDKTSIKVAKFNKDLNILINLREVKALFRDYFDMKKDKKLSLITNNWQIFKQEAFEQLINTFISASVLHYYNLKRKLHVKTDASELAYASILS